MSDVLYYITAKSKGKEPCVMFLNWNTQWSYNSENARTLDLYTAKNNAEHEPTHCLFVEANDGLQYMLSEIFKENKQLSYKQFKELIEIQHCRTETTRE